MARTAAAGFWSQVRAGIRTVRRRVAARAAAAVGLALLSLTFAAAAQGQSTDAVKGTATFSAEKGYARLVLKLAEDVNSQVSTEGSIIVIRFERPVDIDVDAIGDAVPDYVSSARRDPDGMAIRLALARKVTINTMVAGEQTFIDFLPDGWAGPPPSLPLEVVRQLAERARAAERLLRQQRAADAAKKRPPIRVRALVQPTFVRFVFPMPEGVGVSSVLNDQKLTLAFNAALNFDLADAKVAAPPNIASIEQKVDVDSTKVEITLIGDVDVHSFREERNYIADVAFQQADKSKALLPAADASHLTAAPVASAVPSAAPAAPSPSRPAMAAAAQPAPVAPAKIAPPPAPAVVAPPAQPPVTAPHAGEIKPPDSAAIARQAKLDVKPTPSATAVKPIPSVVAAQMAEPPTPEPLAIEGPLKPAAAAPAAKPSEKPEPPAAANAVNVAAIRDSDGLRLTFSFPKPTPAAAFRRGDTVWLVFDSDKPIDLAPIRAKAGAIMSDVSVMPVDKGEAIRFRLNRPQMHSLDSADHSGGTTWTLTFADRVLTPPEPLMVLRNITDPALANIAIPFSYPGRLHRIVDPDAGDALLVVTAPPPIRGFIKRQDFVDFTLLDTAHGIAIRPNSDQVAVEIAPGKVIVGRPGGLTLSSVDIAAGRAPAAVRPIFDIDDWHHNQAGRFIARQDELIGAAASAGPEQRPAARLELARFYMARGLYAEARGETEFMLSDHSLKGQRPAALMVHAIACILTNRPDQGLKDLADPLIGNNYDAQLWQALAYAKQGKWALAREKFKNVEFGIAALPLELQRIVTVEAMQASLEVKDYAGAARRRSELDVVGVPPEMQPSVAVLRGRLAEALGQERDALDQYRFAVDSPDREAAAEAEQRTIALKEKRGEISQADELRELETLAMTWRGDAIEVKTLQMLARIYSRMGRYSDSLTAARSATKLEPNSEVSRKAQDEASALFSQLFLGPKGDKLPPIEALGMFYEFRELTPIGRLGDEMIRKLADRLVAVDLLDQAAELLQYQVDHRLEGAARAQVAAKLAMVYLADRKPDKAIAALRSTRIADLSGELRAQRLLLEARAQSDIGRHDLALDIASNITGREAVRLRSDIYWAARRWRESAEQIELYYGDRWRDFKPLNAAEKGDIIRAVIGYALAEDAIGLARFREKYAPLMSGESDKLAFDIASKPVASNSAEFEQIAKMAGSVDTLDGFLREMKARFPDGSARDKADPTPTGSLPKIVGSRHG